MATPASLTDKPLKQPVGNNHYVKIHVCQASYGDCLALEFDHDASSPGTVGLIPEVQRLTESVTLVEEKQIRIGKKIVVTVPAQKTIHERLVFSPDHNLNEQRLNVCEDRYLRSEHTDHFSKDPNRRVILIDGGPGNFTIRGKHFTSSTPAHVNLASCFSIF
jgi:hypothetical protein